MKANSLGAWLVAARPYSLGNSVIVIMAATALAAAEGSIRWVPALLCLLFAMLMQSVANLVNDLWDSLRGADRADRLGPDRAVAKGYITRRAMVAGISVTTLAGCAAGLALLWWAVNFGHLAYGGWELVACGAACVTFAYLYTAGPWPLAYHGLGDVAVVVFFGIVPVGFCHYLQCGAWSTAATAVGIACGLVIDTMLMLNNFRDYEQDRISRKRTLVVLLGRKFGLWAYLVLGFAAAGSLAILVAGHSILPLLFAIPYLVLHVATWRKMRRIDHGTELNACLGDTSRNIWIFGILTTIALALG